VRAKEVDPEDDKRDADRDEQSVAWNCSRREAPGDSTDDRRRCHPCEDTPVDPARPNVGDGRCQGGDRGDPDVGAGPRRRARRRENDDGQAYVAEHETDETARDRGRKAPEGDGDEGERVQALEYRR
jgi:hypothetical protein